PSPLSIRFSIPQWGARAAAMRRGGEQARVLPYRGIGFEKPFSQLYSILSKKSIRRENFSQKASVLPEGLRSPDGNEPPRPFSFCQSFSFGPTWAQEKAEVMRLAFCAVDGESPPFANNP
ncbi:MAG: hypothetical protein IIW78_01020, partial [Clostridia bacterium]|nr:hypothetical protein [Clostridia bacterium]